MDITMEQVEKVRSCTGVSYQEAKQALEQTGGRVLDAVIFLEQQGKSQPAGGNYSTRPSGAGAGQTARPPRQFHWDQAWAVVKSLVRHCLSISLEIWKSGRMTCMIPLIAALLLILVAPYAVVGLLLVGLCFGYRIHISGRGTEGWGERVNQLADQVGDTVNDAVAQLRRSRGKSHKKG